MRRVVITGMAGVTALGDEWPTIRAAFAEGRTGIRFMEEWERFTGINTRLAAPVLGFSVEERYPRKKTRTMGRVSQMAVYATERALMDAKLLGDPIVTSGRTGIAYGSSFGSPDAVLGFYELKKLHPDDEPHRGGEHRHVLRRHRPHHPDLERLHFG
jgi:3-oxoacyl-[acyl-carrier-protein] synthase II